MIYELFFTWFISAMEPTSVGENSLATRCSMMRLFYKKFTTKPLLWVMSPQNSYVEVLTPMPQNVAILEIYLWGGN